MYVCVLAETGVPGRRQHREAAKMTLRKATTVSAGWRDGGGRQEGLCGARHVGPGGPLACD